MKKQPKKLTLIGAERYVYSGDQAKEAHDLLNAEIRRLRKLISTLQQRQCADTVSDAWTATSYNLHGLPTPDGARSIIARIIRSESMYGAVTWHIHFGSGFVIDTSEDFGTEQEAKAAVIATLKKRRDELLTIAALGD